MTRRRLIVSCEHGGNDVPAEYALWFRGRTGLLATHRGYDPGALELARHLASAFKAPLHVSVTTRLLVDLNRSIGHPDLFAPWVRDQGRAETDAVIRRHYHPYRHRVERRIAGWIAAGVPVFHVSVHTFTPVRNGVRRTADVGLLYDPRRSGEPALAKRWQKKLQEVAPAWRVRRNYPYRGVADGFLPYLRRRYPASLFAGIELEVNQKHTRRPPRELEGLGDALARTLAAALASNA